jgi:hypothetical protein
MDKWDKNSLKILVVPNIRVCVKLSYFVKKKHIYQI